MKYYDTHYEEYVQSVKTHNIHPELKPMFDSFPKSIKEFGNLIIYGACGSGKYSQVLYLLEKYSPTHLKYDKRITVNTEKQSYKYRISDIHYEIDMGLLGCHSKLLWHELFFQIVDIISMKPEKMGVLVCKNFHMIHSELLEVFYSYIQHSSRLMPNMCIRFILITEHISFIPNNILNCCEKVSVKKPTKTDYMSVLFTETEVNELKRQIASENQSKKSGGKRSQKKLELTDDRLNTGKTIQGQSVQNLPNDLKEEQHELFVRQIHNPKLYVNGEQYQRAKDAIDQMGEQIVVNMKELQLLKHTEMDNLPKDIFNVICDNIIAEISNSQNLVFTNFRENLYDILIYNLDITECVWYILSHFIRIGEITNVTKILPTIYKFLKYYNNNYRPIYHLESILFYLLLEVRKQKPSNEQKAGATFIRNTRNEHTSRNGRHS
jgi:hypothetical protein